jgi:hypothetical protein
MRVRPVEEGTVEEGTVEEITVEEGTPDPGAAGVTSDAFAVTRFRPRWQEACKEQRERTTR